MHASQQTYVQRLGFQDPDRSNPRHGLACEYLLQRLIEQAHEKALRSESQPPAGDHQKQWWDALARAVGEQAPKPAECINVPIKNRSFINGFADVLSSWQLQHESGDYWDDDDRSKPIQKVHYECWYWLPYQVLGEIKITKEPAERVLQQINFYRQYLIVGRVIILVDYDDPQLKRMTAGSDIEVYRLGSRFESWCLAQQRSPVAATVEL